MQQQEKDEPTWDPEGWRPIIRDDLAAATMGASEEEVDYALPLDPAPTYEFVTGLAGTGKTYLTKERFDKYRGNELVATTGIAAINVGGVTLNSLLRYFDTAEMKQAYVEGWLYTRLKKLWESGCRRLMLDEVSMLDANQLTYLTRAIKDVNTHILDGGWEEYSSFLLDSEKPENPELLSLTLVGDFCQLSPIKAPYAFSSPEWDEFEKNTVKLTEIKRQSNKDFAEALNLVRSGQGLKAAEFFAPLFQKRVVDDFAGPTIMAKNDEVDRYNSLRHDLCVGEPFSFKAQKSEKQRPEWRNIPEELTLKEGAQVMVLANQNLNGMLTYVNGDIGTFVGNGVGYTTTTGGMKEYKGATVKLHRTEQEVVVAPVTRDYKEPREEKAADRKDVVGRQNNGMWKVVGSVTYMPLRLAYASTVHKTQGLSFDSLQVNILSHFFTYPAMLYVALSRARNPEGLRLVGSVEQFIKRCVFDPKVRGYL